MTREAIADARSLIRDVAHRNWASDLDGLNQAVTNVVIALDRICDAVESLDRDEGPRLPLDPKLWEMRVRTDTHDGAVDPPDDRGGWHLVAPTGVASCGYHFSFFLWARKREES